MKVLAYVEPSGRAVLELPPRPAGEWVEVEVAEPPSDPDRLAALARIEARRVRWAVEHPEEVRSAARILADLHAERDAWEDR